MLRIITINEEGGFNMDITNKSIKTGGEQESQQSPHDGWRAR